MSHFTNLTLSGHYAVSGTLSLDGESASVTAAGLLTAIITHNIDGSLTGTWRFNGTVMGTLVSGESLSEAVSDTGSVSGSLLQVQFTSSSAVAIVNGAGSFNGAGTAISLHAVVTVPGLTGSLAGAGTLARQSSGSSGVGTAGPDVFDGTDGDDVFRGGGGDDQISGGAGSDRLFGDAGNDVIDGGDGDDRLSGGTGDDTLISGAGNDLLDGGDGTDTAKVLGSLSDYGITVSDGPNDGRLFFTLSGLEPGDVVNMVSRNGHVTKLAGVEKVVFLGNLLDASDDVEVLVNPNALLSGVRVLAGTNYMADTGNTGLLNGTAAADILDGMEGNDQLNGLGGNDTLDGGVGDDTLAGGAGNDTYLVDSAGDVVTELAAQGVDTVKTALASYVLPENVERLEYTGSGDFTGTGNALANTLKGGAGNDTLDGGAGADRMEGGAGDDTYVVDRVASADGTLPGDVVFEGTALLDSGGNDTVRATLRSYALGTNVENLVFVGVGNFTGTGNGLANRITGGEGNDTLNGGAGDDVLVGGSGNDVMNGGAGEDTAELAGLRADYVFARLSLTSVRATEKASGEAETLNGMEVVRFGDATTARLTLDELLANTASPFDDVFTGTDAQDTFDGLAGHDMIEGGGGSDTLSGGAGNDTLDGGLGDDTLAGGVGNDTYVVDSAGDVVTENLNQGADTVKTALASYVLPENVERLEYTGAGGFAGTGNGLANRIVGGAGEDTLEGVGGGDTLLGGEGNDTLDGGAGADRMEGGAGDDTYVVDNALDVVFEGGALTDAGGNDTVRTTLRSYALGTNVENLVFAGVGNFTGTGNGLANRITGGEGNDTLNGGVGDDVLVGGSGNDTLNGGAGEDTAELAGLRADYVFARLSLTSVRVTEKASGEAETLNGMEVVRFGDATTARLTLDELLANTASPFDDVFTGTDAQDTFDGLAGHDMIEGGGGSDTLSGGAGNDTLDGGLGDDTLAGGAGNDTYVVDSAGDVVTENLNQGADTVKTALATYALPDNVERLEYTGAGDFAGTGNGLANRIVGGAGEDTLEGVGGGDTLLGGEGNDTLDGGAGADRMEGGAGDDTYVVDNALDVVFEGGALTDTGGNDTVQASVGYTLGANVENLLLTGSLNISGTGNLLDNQITGNDGNNILSGGAGNDTLRGGAGADTLRGGAGNDIFVFDNLGAADRVADFAGGGVDRIALDAAAFGALGWDNGVLVAGMFESVSNLADAGPGTRLVYSTGTGELFYDAQLVAVFGPAAHPAIVAADFMQA